MDPHRLAELRSIALHEAIARRIEREPRLLDDVRTRVEGWLRDGTVAPEYARRWASVLTRPLPELLAFLVEDTEPGRDLRQVTPFAGLLDARLRWQIWRKVRDDAASAGASASAAQALRP